MDSAVPSSTSPNPQRIEATEQSVVLPVIEEQAIITREVVEQARVRLTKTVHEREEILAMPLQHEEVVVERVPINQFVADGAVPPVPRYDGDITIIPVLREVVVTRLLVVEEIRVVKRIVSTTHTESVTLRHEEIHVERQLTDPLKLSSPAAAASTAAGSV